MSRKRDDLNKCALCGKFCKNKELVLMQAEGDEQWLECKECMSESDRNTYFPKNDEREWTSHNDRGENCLESIEKLNAKLEKAKKVIKFYASCALEDMWEPPFDGGSKSGSLGDAARAVLKEIGDE